MLNSLRWGLGTATPLALLCLGLALTGFALGCGGAPPTATDSGSSDAGPSDAGSTDAGSTDAGTPDSGFIDAGSPDAGFVIAPHQMPPQVTRGAGPVIAVPRLLLATFPNEPLAASLETFAQTIGATSYWSATTAEYGVGPAQFARAVHVASAPAATLSDVQVEAWLAAQLDGTHPEWGTPDPSTIYTLVYPLGTTITRNGQSVCSQSPAFHPEVKVAGGAVVPYVVIARCDPFAGLSGIDYVTGGLSHEWIEAATDPYYTSNPAYDGPSLRYTAWTLVTGGELADMCTLTDGVYFKPAGFPFTVQRSWSNASAMVGHDPCVPQPAAAYFGAAPLLSELVSVKLYNFALSLEGMKIALGQSRVVEVDLFSDDTTDPWALSAVDYGAVTGGGGNLGFSWNKQVGSNGDKLELTITRIKDSPQLVGGALFGIVSSRGPQQSVWIGAVGN